MFHFWFRFRLVSVESGLVWCCFFVFVVVAGVGVGVGVAAGVVASRAPCECWSLKPIQTFLLYLYFCCRNIDFKLQMNVLVMFSLLWAVVFRDGFIKVVDGVGRDEQVAGGVDDVRVVQLLLAGVVLSAGFIETGCDNAYLIGDV